MTMQGADPTALRRLATTFQRASVELRNMEHELHRMFTASHWRGPDSDRARREWVTQERRHIGQAADLLSNNAQVLKRQAAEQEHASRAGGSNGGGGSGGSPGGPVNYEGIQAGLEWASFIETLGGAESVISQGGLLKVLEKNPGLFSSMGSLKKFPYLGALISAGSIGTTWSAYGPGDARTWDAFAGAAGVALGPVYGLVYGLSYEGTRALLEVTGADEYLGEAGYDAAYGERGEMTPAQAAEVTRRAHSWKIVPDFLGGGFRRLFR